MEMFLYWINERFNMTLFSLRIKEGNNIKLLNTQAFIHHKIR